MIIIHTKLNAIDIINYKLRLNKNLLINHTRIFTGKII